VFGVPTFDVGGELYLGQDAIRADGALAIRWSIRLVKSQMDESNESDAVDVEALVAQLAESLIGIERDFAAAIALAPEEPAAYLERARFRLETARTMRIPAVAAAVAESSGIEDFHRGALADYTRVIELHAALPAEHSDAVLSEVYINVARIFHRLGGLEPSSVTATLAIELLEPKPVTHPMRSEVLAQAYKLRGINHHLQGLLDQAMGDYDLAFAIAPDDGELLSNRGEALVALGRFEEAKRDFDRSLELGHAHPLTYAGRAQAAEALGDTARAVADFQSALELDPSHEPASEGLARLS
jgi:tetratricopeptide (TPR) repeat protein